MPWPIHELLFLLFSAAEMMLATLIKGFLVESIKREMSFPPTMATANSSNYDLWFLNNTTEGYGTLSDAEYSAIQKLSPASQSEKEPYDNASTRFDVQGHFSLNDTGRVSRTSPFLESAITEEKDADIAEKVAWYLMLDLVCAYLPWIALGPLIGIWSDRNGRKALLVLPCLTHVLSVLTYQLAPYWPGHLQVIVVVGGLFRGLTGKQAMFTTAVYGLLSDLLPAHERSTRFAYLLASRYAGVCLGTMAAGLLQDTVGIIYTMDISSIPQIVCLVIVIVFIKDTTVVSSSKAEDKQSIQGEKQTNKELGELQRNKVYWVVSRCIRRILYQGNDDERKALVACEEKTNISGKQEINNILSKLTNENGKEKRMIITDKKEKRLGELSTSSESDNKYERKAKCPLNETCFMEDDKENDRSTNISPGEKSSTESCEEEKLLKASDRNRNCANDGKGITESREKSKGELKPASDIKLMAENSVTNSAEDLTIETCEEGQRQQTNMGMLVLIFSMSLVTQSVWSSQREVIVQSVSVPPLNWPVSWYGYLFSVYFGAAGIGLIFLAPLIRRMSPPSSDSDVNTLVCAIMFGTLGCLWTGLAIVAESDWQVFMGSILSALALMSNSTLRSMASKNARADLQGTVMALMSVKENLSKVLGPIFHSAILVATFPLCPTLVYYVMAVEAFLMLGIVAFIRWRQCKENQYEVL